MPDEKIRFTPKSQQMNVSEILTITKQFVDAGVQKIRLTGGEPLIRRDVEAILRGLSKFSIKLAMTTNGILLDEYFDILEEVNLKDINISLDSLDKDKFKKITKRDYFDKVLSNIYAAIDRGFRIKLNTVLIKGFNDDEILELIELSLKSKVDVRFIEFMPFDGNNWDFSQMVSQEEILDKVYNKYNKESVEVIPSKKHQTANNFRLPNSIGSFGIISSVTNPFCDTCNRLRLTSDGKMKNCLFSNDEADLLTLVRANKSIKEAVNLLINKKNKVRAGMNNLDDFKTSNKHSINRSMVRIGG